MNGQSIAKLEALEIVCQAILPSVMGILFCNYDFRELSEKSFGSIGITSDAAIHKKR